MFPSFLSGFEPGKGHVPSVTRLHYRAKGAWLVAGPRTGPEGALESELVLKEQRP